MKVSKITSNQSNALCVNVQEVEHAFQSSNNVYKLADVDEQTLE